MYKAIFALYIHKAKMALCMYKAIFALCMYKEKMALYIHKAIFSGMALCMYVRPYRKRCNVVIDF
jgi:hypothetical protein